MSKDVLDRFAEYKLESDSQLDDGRWCLLDDMKTEIERLRAALRNIIDQEDMAEARVIASTALHDPYRR